MELDRIERLLEKYFEATTTASEEATLRAYFSQTKVAEQFEQYAPMFRYFAKEKEERYTKEVTKAVLKPKVGASRKIWYSWAATAAIVLLLAGVYFNTSYSSYTLEDEYTQEEIAAAQEALSLLSINFNKGAGQITYLEEFEKNTNRFLDNGQKSP